MLVAAENFAEAAFGAGAFDGVADGGVGGDDGEAREFRRDIGLLRGAFVVPKHEAAALLAAAGFAEGEEVALAPDVLFGAETHDNGLLVVWLFDLPDVRRR